MPRRCKVSKGMSIDEFTELIDREIQEELAKS